LELFKLRGGVEVKGHVAAAKAITRLHNIFEMPKGCCFGLMQGDSREVFLYDLAEATNAKICEEGPDGVNLELSC
jgi:hypothetical protein